MSEELFQSLIRDLEQQKPIRERLAKLKDEKLDALKRETEAAIARAPTESSPDRRKTYERLRELMIDTTRDILLSSLLEATEGITRSGRPEEQPEPKAEQPRAQESAQPSASDQAPKESLNVFEKNPVPTATQKSAMGFREWVRSQRGQPAPAEGTWNKIVSWFDVQSPNPEQNYDENIWSKPKYWFAYGVYRLMDWWNGWGKKKPAAAPEQKKQPEALPPAPAPSNPEAQQKPVLPAPAKPNPEAQQQAPATSAQQTAPADKPVDPTVQQTQTPAPSGTAPALAATNPAETISVPENLLDGERMINGHRIVLSSNNQSLLSIDDVQYAASSFFIDLHGVLARGLIQSINYSQGRVIVQWKSGIRWDLSPEATSALIRNIRTGTPDKGFTVNMTYTRISTDGQTINKSSSISFHRLRPRH